MNELEKLVMYNDSIDAIFILMKVNEKILAIEVSNEILAEQIIFKNYETMQDLVESSIFLCEL